MVPNFSNMIFYIQIYQNGEESGERICSSNPLFFYHFCQKLSFSPTFCLPHYDEHYPVITSLCTITNIPIGSVSSSLLTSMFAENCLCHYLCLCLYHCPCICHFNHPSHHPFLRPCLRNTDRQKSSSNQ